MGWRSGPGLFPRVLGAAVWLFSAKPGLPPSPQPWPIWDGGVGQVQVPCRAALCFTVAASNGVSRRFADDTRSSLGLMQWN